MSHFYGTMKGSRGEATRCGTKNSGMETYCASWDGAVRCYAYQKTIKVDCDKGEVIYEDWVKVELTTWQGKGKYKVLYEGPIGGDSE